MTIEQAKAEVLQSIKNGHHEMEAGYPYENPLNDRQRQLIAAYREQYGECWLGRIDAPSKDSPIMWEWGGELVFNFGASFVVPCYDSTLEGMIRQWRAGSLSVPGGPWEFIKALKALHARIQELDGQSLIWK